MHTAIAHDAALLSDFGRKANEVLDEILKVQYGSGRLQGHTRLGTAKDMV